jgi:hypothetical protein
MPRTPDLTRDEVLKRMLKTPPSPHIPAKAKKAASRPDSATKKNPKQPK